MHKTGKCPKCGKTVAMEKVREGVYFCWKCEKFSQAKHIWS